MGEGGRKEGSVLDGLISKIGWIFGRVLVQFPERVLSSFGSYVWHLYQLLLGFRHEENGKIQTNVSDGRRLVELEAVTVLGYGKACVAFPNLDVVNRTSSSEQIGSLGRTWY